MKVKVTYQSSFEFHVCFDEAGSREAIAMDVVFRWRVPQLKDKWYSETVLRMSRPFSYDGDDIGFLTLPVRYTPKGNMVFGTGRNRAKFPRRGNVRSGGNILWDVVLFPRARQAHVLNYLRRQVWDYEEWDHEFREEVWESRRALDLPALQRYGRSFVLAFLKLTADAKCCTVKELFSQTQPA